VKICAKVLTLALIALVTVAGMTGCLQLGKTEAPATIAEAGDVKWTLNTCRMVMRNAEGTQIEQFVQMKEGKPVRVRTEANEGWMLLDVNERMIYSYQPIGNLLLTSKAYKKVGDKVIKPPLMFVRDLEQEAPILGEEAIDGVECWVAETTVKEGGAKVKVWIDKDYALLCQSQEGKETVRYGYDQVDEIADLQFEIPHAAQSYDVDNPQPRPKQM